MGPDPAEVASPRRILVYGVTGCGKTTFAQELGARLGIPAIEVDQITWGPDWTPIPEEEQRRRIADICAGDAWVIDSAYRIWLDVVLERVDLIIGLDYSRATSLSRLVWRTAARLVDRRRVCNGNVETLRQAFSRQSIVAWHFKSFDRKRATMHGWKERPPCRVVLFERPRAARAWLDGIGQVP